MIRHQQLPCHWPPSDGLPPSSWALEERFDALVEANDILLERVVRDGCIMDMVVPWNTSTVDTTGNQRFVPYSEVSLTQGLPVYFG